MTETQIINFVTVDPDDETTTTSKIYNYDSEVEISLKSREDGSSSDEDEEILSDGESEVPDKSPTPIIYINCSSEEPY